MYRSSKILVIMLLFAFITLNASDVPDEKIIRRTYNATISTEELFNIDDPSSTEPVDDNGFRNIALEGEVSYPNNGTRWNTDFQVTAKNLGGIDWDTDFNNGVMYAVVDMNNAVFDSLVVFESTNHGETWNPIITGTNSDSSIVNPKIRVARDSTGTTWICVFGIWQESGDDKLWMRRFNPGPANAQWEEVTTNVEWFDVDAETGDDAYLHVVTVPTGTTDLDVYRTRLTGTWLNYGTIFSVAQVDPQPAIAAGPNGNVGVAFIDNRLSSNEIRVKRSTNHGTTWSGSQEVSSASPTVTYPDIAYSYASTDSVAWIWTTYEISASDHNVGFYHSSDNGANWTYGGVMSDSLSTDEYETSIRSNKLLGGLTVGYKSADSTAAKFVWATAGAPTSFTYPQTISDNWVTNLVHPMVVAGWTDNNYSGLMYVQWGASAVWFDWFGNTGVEEKEIATDFHLSSGICTNGTKLNYSIPRSGKVTIRLLDITGRTVKTLVNEAKNSGSYQIDIRTDDLNPGVYFARINAPELNKAKKLTVVR